MGADDCEIAECFELPVNTVERDTIRGPILVARCRTHTSRWDRVILGPDRPRR